jgi:putative restriction endonuclease
LGVELSQQARRVLSIIVQHIKTGRVRSDDPRTFLGYKEVHDALALQLIGRTYGEILNKQGLGDLAGWLLKHGFPSATGLVIDKENLHPGDGYFKFFSKEDDYDWWLREVESTLRFDWEPYINQETPTSNVVNLTPDNSFPVLSVINNLTREDILRAFKDYEAGVQHTFADSTHYDVLYEGQRYPPKAIVGLAARYQLGKPLRPSDFSGGESSTCFRVLRSLGFTVVPKGDRAPQDKVLGFLSGSRKYWWVNHKQTHNEEIEGGYIWSPKENSDGSTNQTYLNLTKVQVGDIVFSYAFGEIRAVGIAEHRHQDAERPSAFGKTGEQWVKDGWVVQVNWHPLNKPLSPKEHMSDIAHLLPEKNSPIRANGKGNQGCYLAAIGDDLGMVLLELIRQDNIGVYDSLDELDASVLEDEEEKAIEGGDIKETEKEQLVKARRGQGLFRMRLEPMECACRLTGVKDKRLLVASHIKSWRFSDNREKLDGNNGLLLSPHVDKLFDRGLISFSDEGTILLASSGVRMVMEQWGLDPDKHVGTFNQSQKQYLAFHRETIFRRIEE